jgi:hypothetical protein
VGSRVFEEKTTFHDTEGDIDKGHSSCDSNILDVMFCHQVRAMIYYYWWSQDKMHRLAWDILNNQSERVEWD